MAINPAKLLPPSKAGGALVKASQKTIVATSITEKSAKDISIVRVKTIRAEKILKGTLAIEKKELDEKKRSESSQRREKQEEKLETRSNVEKGQLKMPKLPRMGILDWIKNFIGNVILGYFAVRLIKHLPKIMPIVKFLGSAADFIIDVGGKLLNGLVTFVDWGYKAYDATKGFLKNFGGENFAKGFDKFIGAVDTALFLTSILAADLAVEVMTGGGGPDGIDPSKRPKPVQGGKPKVTTSGGGSAGRPDIRNPLRLKPAVTIGKGGAKAVLGTVRPILKRLPIIGALIDFGLSVALGEDPGRAAFKAIGAGLLGSIGAAVGSLAFGFGGIVGGILGSIGGDVIGGALYDMFFGGKKPKPKGKVQGKAGGGITRGGKTQGGVKRTIGGTKKKGKYKRTLAQKPTETKFKTTDKSVKQVSENLDKTKYFGPVLAVSAKILENEKPTQKDYENVGLGLNLLVAKGVEDGQLKGGLVAAFAEGGMVDSDFLEAAEKGSDISNWVARTFQGEIESKVERNLRLIRERKEQSKPAGVPGPGQPGSPDMINIQGGDADFWTLVAVASREDGEPQAWADVAQSIYNRLASGAYSGKTIKDLILGQMQYEPTWKFPKPGVTGKPNQEWYAIKDAASAGVAAGQSEGAMKKVAAAILDPTLQKNAREFIQGRTDFRGYSVSGGVQRKSGDNYYGWYNNYTANKIGSVPNFGATATSTPGGVGPSIELGKGYGGEGSKIAGELGRFLKKKGVVPGSIHRHPEHPPWSRSSGHSKNSYHYQGRAIDLGGYTREQGPILAAIAEFNKLKGVKPVELIHGGIDPSGHGDHVHVAYLKGGRVNRPTFATLAEDGKPEFVFDADTTAGLDRLAPQLLEKLNMAKTKPQLAGILQSYATYEQPYSEPEVVEVPVYIQTPNTEYSTKSSGGDMMIAFGGEDPFESLYVGG